MRLHGYTVALATCMLHVAAAAGMQEQNHPHGRPISNSSAVDSFLRSIDVSPEDVPTSAKTAGGVTLTCAILSAINETQVLVSAEGSVYTAAADENW